ncbi:MAG TPA: hypothetical protein VLB85_01305 [Acidimicrobiia bacterium]|nr:hypothetical protein [Acidimicrobiia bacterium]
MERHRFDALSFAFGVIYTLIGLTFLIPNTPFDLVDMVATSLRWVWPAAILLIGLTILVPLVRPKREE